MLKSWFFYGPGDPCTTTTCQNGGICAHGKCYCTPGFVGQLCDQSKSLVLHYQCYRERVIKTNQNP